MGTKQTPVVYYLHTPNVFNSVILSEVQREKGGGRGGKGMGGLEAWNGLLPRSVVLFLF